MPIFYVSLACGGTFTSPTGSFSSPNFPDYYPNSRDCVFKIIVQVNMQILLNFTTFDLEGSPPSCSYDFVEIRWGKNFSHRSLCNKKNWNADGTECDFWFYRDGGYETSPLVGKFCSNQKPPVLVSHSNRLWVRFHSDASLTHQGFLAHWDGTQTGTDLLFCFSLHYDILQLYERRGRVAVV